MSFEDYVNAYYRGGLDISARYGIKKDDLKTEDSAYFNTMYGASVFNQLNSESDIFKLFRKEGWTQSGWRVMHKRSAAASNIGVVEGAGFGTSDVPDLKQVSASIKEIVSPYTVSTKAAILAESDDGVKGLAAFLRTQAAEAHAYYIDAMLVEPVSTETAVNFESLQRIVADNDLASLGAVAVTDVDIYTTIDRSETGAGESNEDGWANAYVDHGTISTNETCRDLTLSMLDKMIQSAIENGAQYSDLILLTGYQQLTELKQLITAGTSNATWRMTMESQAPKGTNGVQSQPGMNLDGRVGYYDSIPIYASQHLTANKMDNQAVSGGTKTAMGPIFLLDMSNLYMKIAAPTTFLAQEDLANVQALKRNYAFMTAGEIICTKFKSQGILRGLEYTTAA